MAARNLSRHRRRTLVNVLGIAVTVGSLLFFQAFYRGSYEELMFGTIIDYQSAHIQVKTPSLVDEDPDSYVSESSMISGWEPLREGLLGIHGVRGVSARLVVPSFAGDGIRKRAVLLAGVDETADRAVLRTLERLADGRHFSGPGQVLVGASLARLFGLKPGDSLRVQVRTVDDVPNIQAFTIEGLFSTGSPQIDRGMVFASLADVQDLTSAGDRVNRIYLRAVSVDAVGAVRSDVTGAIARHPRSEATPGAGLHATTWEESAEGIIEHSRGDRLFMLVFLSILLVLALSTVAGTMYMAVFERTREIGALRAMGWHRSEVFRLFSIKAGLIGLGGAALGIVLGGAASVWLAWFPIDMGGIASSLEIPFLRVTCRLTGLDAVVSSLAGAAAALAAGLAPARRASRMEIVKALATH